MPNNHAAKKIEVNGIVQGVGFRPFVYNLADQYDLKGEVANTAAGVSILIEGSPQNILAFETALTTKCPPLAHVVEISGRTESVKPFAEFRIVKSRGQAQMATLISPDVSICDDCRQELFDPKDRRFRYPFINCTNCGPRWSIIRQLPYDRPRTSMARFSMCPECRGRS